jgi:hypothetical protein
MNFVRIPQLRLWLFLLTAALTLHASGQPPAISASRLDRLVQDKRYPELEQQLQSARLDSTERTYFTGIVADRSNHLSEAIADLEKVLPELKKTNSKHAAIALRALAGDYFRTGRYGEASDTYSDLLNHYASEFSPTERQAITDNRNTFGLFRGAPRQAVSGEREFKVQVRRNVLDNIEVPLQIGNQTEWWILDTGANTTTITVSTAKRVGLTISKTSASTQSGATGKEVPTWATIIPKMTFGEGVVSNVVVLVSEDSEFNVNLGEKEHYQIQGVLGFPVIAALGCLTVSGNELTVSPESPPSSRSTRLYVEELTPLLQATVDGHDLLFGLDTGSEGGDIYTEVHSGISATICLVDHTEVGHRRTRRHALDARLRPAESWFALG